jgi:hypothetical protein
VCAIGPNRKYLGPAAHQEHLLAGDVADQLAAVGKLGERNALSEIGVTLRAWS